MGRKINVEERLLAMMAVEKRFISERQLKECLNAQEFFETEKSLEEILLMKEYLTSTQIDRLKQQLTASTEVNMQDKPNQKRFGEVALEQSMIDSNQLEESLETQNMYLTRGIRVQIGQIINKKGHLTLAQVKRILESQLKKVLYCKSCKTTTTIHNYQSGQIYQCSECNLDLIESKAKKAVKKTKAKPIKQKVKEDIEDDDDIEEEDDDDDGVGKLNILEL